MVRKLDRLEGHEYVEVGNADIKAALGMANNLAKDGWLRDGYWRDGAMWIVRLRRKKEVGSGPSE